VLAKAEALAKGREAAADDAALAPFGKVDPVDWSVEAVRALMAERAAVGCDNQACRVGRCRAAAGSR
jgi:hypothetical protein